MISSESGKEYQNAVKKKVGPLRGTLSKVDIEFRNKLMETNQSDADRGKMWDDFKDKVEESVERRSVSVDMGMDRGV